MKNNIAFIGLMPLNIRQSKVPPRAKLVYSDITRTLDEDGVCRATNREFAELDGNCTEDTISDNISKLKKAGFINSIIIITDINSRRVVREITLTNFDHIGKKPYPLEKTRQGIGKKPEQSYSKKESNNIYNISHARDEQKEEVNQNFKLPSHRDILESSFASSEVIKTFEGYLTSYFNHKKTHVLNPQLEDLINQLKTLSSDPVEQIKIIKMSINKKYTEFFKLVDNKNFKSNNQNNQQINPYQNMPEY